MVLGLPPLPPPSPHAYTGRADLLTHPRCHLNVETDDATPAGGRDKGFLLTQSGFLGRAGEAYKQANKWLQRAGKGDLLYCSQGLGLERRRILLGRGLLPCLNFLLAQRRKHLGFLTILPSWGRGKVKLESCLQPNKK